MNSMKEEVISQALRGVPAVGGGVAYQLTLNGWVAIATLAYIALQTLFLLRQWHMKEVDRAERIRRERVGLAAGEDDASA